MPFGLKAVYMKIIIPQKVNESTKYTATLFMKFFKFVLPKAVKIIITAKTISTNMLIPAGIFGSNAARLSKPPAALPKIMRTSPALMFKSL